MLEAQMSQVAGYVLRFKDEQSIKQVFDMAIYFFNMNRKWSSGPTILFVHKTQSGDAFVGNGVISRETKTLFA